MLGPTGRTGVCNFDFQGIWQPPTDVAILAPTYPTAKGLRYASSTTTWASSALCLENITLDSGNTIVVKECGSTVSGYDHGLITNRVVTVTGNPEARLVAGQDRYGQYLAMTEDSLTWSFDGPTNAVATFTAPRAQIVAITEADRNMLVTDEITWQCNRNGSNIDQEISLTFTAAT
jgi:hypothetical protein